MQIQIQISLPLLGTDTVVYVMSKMLPAEGGQFTRFWDVFMPQFKTTSKEQQLQWLPV